MKISDKIVCENTQLSSDMNYQLQNTTMSANRGIFINLCMFSDIKLADGGMI